MSRGFIFSIVLVVGVVAPWVGRMGSVPDILGDLGTPRARAGEDVAPPSRAGSGEPVARPSSPAAQKPQKTKTPRSRNAAAHTNYQVPAGAVVAVKLRTSVRSAASETGDQVDAVLTESVTRDGVELIPAGSILHGTVVDALRASPLELRGRVAVAFFVIEHAVTGSRAAIKTRAIAIEAPLPVGKRPVDVELTAGQPLNVSLTEPLLIRIPK